jgi:hypothetical protein
MRRRRPASGIQEDVDWEMVPRRGSKARDIFLQIVATGKLDRSDAGRSLERLTTRKYGHPSAKLRIVLEIESNLSRVIAVKPGQPILDVCGIADFGQSLHH